MVGSFGSFISNGLTRFKTVVSHFYGRDDNNNFFPFSYSFLRHSLRKCVSRLYCTFVKGVI